MWKLLFSTTQSTLVKWCLPIFIVAIVGASTASFYKGYSIGQAVERESLAEGLLQSQKTVRATEHNWYKKQVTVLTANYDKKLELERANVRIKTITKTITKQAACKISKNTGGKPVLSNDYIRLYNEAVLAANRAARISNTSATTKTMSTDEDSEE